LSVRVELLTLHDYLGAPPVFECLCGAAYASWLPGCTTSFWEFVWSCLPFATTWVHHQFLSVRVELLILRHYLGAPPVFDSVRVAHLFVFCDVFLFLVLFVSCLMCLMLPVSLDCPVLISPSVFSNIYLCRSRRLLLGQYNCRSSMFNFFSFQWILYNNSWESI